MTDENNALREEKLRQFTGTEQWYRHPMFKTYLYTDGVQYVAEKGGAYWLIDDILMYQSTDKNIQKTSMCVWTLTRNENGRGAVLKCEDGNFKPLFSTDITFTDFPLKQIVLWCCDNVLLLPSEY